MVRCFVEKRGGKPSEFKEGEKITIGAHPENHVELSGTSARHGYVEVGPDGLRYFDHAGVMPADVYNPYTHEWENAPYYSRGVHLSDGYRVRLKNRMEITNSGITDRDGETITHEFKVEGQTPEEPKSRAISRAPEGRAERSDGRRFSDSDGVAGGAMEISHNPPGGLNEMFTGFNSESNPIKPYELYALFNGQIGNYHELNGRVRGFYDGKVAPPHEKEKANLKHVLAELAKGGNAAAVLLHDEHPGKAFVATKGDMKVHVFRDGTLTTVVSLQETPEGRFGRIILKPKDRVVITGPGLHDNLGLQEIGRILSRHRYFDEAMAELVDAARSRTDRDASVVGFEHVPDLQKRYSLNSAPLFKRFFDKVGESKYRLKDGLSEQEIAEAESLTKQLYRRFHPDLYKEPMAIGYGGPEDSETANRVTKEINALRGLLNDRK